MLDNEGTPDPSVTKVLLIADAVTPTGEPPLPKRIPLAVKFVAPVPPFITSNVPEIVLAAKSTVKPAPVSPAVRVPTVEIEDCPRYPESISIAFAETEILPEVPPTANTPAVKVKPLPAANGSIWISLTTFVKPVLAVIMPAEENCVKLIAVVSTTTGSSVVQTQPVSWLAVPYLS